MEFGEIRFMFGARGTEGFGWTGDPDGVFHLDQDLGIEFAVETYSFDIPGGIDMRTALHSTCIAALCLVIICACIAPGRMQELSDPARAAAGPVYRPQLPPDLGSLDAAMNRLGEALSGMDAPAVKPLTSPEFFPLSNKHLLGASFGGSLKKSRLFYDAQGMLFFFEADPIRAFPDRIEVSARIVFYYRHLLDLPIVVERTMDVPDSIHSVDSIISSQYFILYDPLRQFKIDFPGHISFYFEDRKRAERFADTLFYIQQHLVEERNAEFADFEAKAATWRRSGAKPSLTEEQRRYIVQANALSQKKEYPGAIDLYLKAIAIDPVSYPAAYFNLALLSAQTQQYRKAIGFMKRYLALEPDAKDARSAQDKIYEWELNLAGGK
ncbi:MAG: tetratricopeptide repeat protein [Desulfobacterales bacterium]